VDVVFHPRILQDPPLIRFEGTQVGLAEVNGALAEQLKGVSGYYDGVIWVRPSDADAPAPSTRPAASAPSELAVEGGNSVLSRPFEVRLDPGRYRKVGRGIGQSGGYKLPGPGRTRRAGRSLAARGSLGEVLEAARLACGWRWVTAGTGRRRAVFAHPRGRIGRSVP